MANWLSFEQLSRWDALVLLGFQYDAVTDADIAAALSDTSTIQHIDTRIDWEDDAWLDNFPGIPDDKKHGYRVAALVAELQAGGQLQQAIELDTFCIGRCCSGVANGHHRVRALQYLGFPVAPFSLGGHLDLLERLVKKAGTQCPESLQRFIAPRLLAMDPENDGVAPIRLRRKRA